MNILIRVLCALAFGVALSVAHAKSEPKWEFSARVSFVDDGDTVWARKDSGERIKVRLANVDAPETGHTPCKKGQPWGDQSSEALKKLVMGKWVNFQCFEKDRFHRSVCDIQIGDTTVARELASRGMAWANRADPRYLRDPVVGRLEREARASKVGLWASESPIPPWEWRKTVAAACSRDSH